MTLKNDVENAKDAVAKALVTALNDKNEGAIKPLMNVYNLISTIKLTNIFSINDYTNININSGIGAAGSSDVITFS